MYANPWISGVLMRVDVVRIQGFTYADGVRHQHIHIHPYAEYSSSSMPMTYATINGFVPRFVLTQWLLHKMLS